MTDPQMQDTAPGLGMLESRRTLLRRSLFGATAVGLTGLLAACGDDDDGETVVTGQGAEDPGEEPGIEEETGIGQGSDGTPEG